ncbi:hypothetical protein [Leucothrix arctica]|uniref:Uncharacterized protein n=1 Tax=Leucothrix arctica TaxID=1481894 RepID=A0A317C6N1_9GAMM|nr:hypothetical protein [Leucothrix arctica]PWQ93861.1 hypothetical protein DKT75_19870 [Leucothrix arctica]
MIKPLSLLSISTIALLATTQAHSHVLCAPNNPQLIQSHSHNQAYTVPRIQVSQQNNQKHVQAQRARQQKALANQQRITQQRRAQALAQQKQAQARKNAVIQQQRVAAQRAQAARQKAALIASQRATAQRRQVVSKPVYRTPVQTVRYVAPAPVVYVQQPVYRAPAPTRVYRPATSYVSVQLSSGSNRHYHQPAARVQQRHVNTYNSGRHNNRMNAQNRQFRSNGNARAAYRYAPQAHRSNGSRHINGGNNHQKGHSGKAVYYNTHK